MTDAPEKNSILIVDDKAPNLLLLEHNLSGLRLDIVKAFSGAEAIAKAGESDFAIILLDVHMPGMDGFQVAVELRKRERTRYTPIIFITAFGQNDVFEFRGYESGAVDYLTKPVDAEILKSKIKIFTELYNQRKLIEKQKLELALKVEELQKAMSEIKTLRGIIPICVHCKKIRDDKGFWEAVEKYIEERSEAGFSHGICPDCLRKYFPDIAAEILDGDPNGKK